MYALVVQPTEQANAGGGDGHKVLRKNFASKSIVASQDLVPLRSLRETPGAGAAPRQFFRERSIRQS